MDINQIWDLIAPYVTGTGIGAIIGGILFACLKGAFERTISKIDAEKIAKNISNETIEKTLGQLKTVSFTQTIQPLIEEELKKVVKALNGQLNDTIGKTQDNYKALLEVMVGFSKYFENGYGIPEEAKTALKEAIEKAQELAKDEQAITYEVKIDENNNVVNSTEVKLEESVQDQAEAIENESSQIVR